MRIESLDTTLRDGAGSTRVAFSTSDKCKIIKLLDELGIDIIEVGNPLYSTGSASFFEALPALSLKHAEIAVFGSTCRADVRAEEDEGLLAMASCGVHTAVLFGKAWSLHVEDVLKTDKTENLRIIRDSIAFLRSREMRVIFDAEHFFDGFKEDEAYARAVVETAWEAGAETVVLCDTNGGTFPDEISAITAEMAKDPGRRIGVHCHNDAGFAAANTVMAVKNGAWHVQGTLNGVGERCGNANLATVIADLQLKCGFSLIPEDCMKKLTPVCRAVAEISNISLQNLPYVSPQAFAHKAGMHIDGVIKNHRTFEHIDPTDVGNTRDFLMSENAGKSAVSHLLRRIAPQHAQDTEKTEAVLRHVKDMEHLGYQFEAADASLELAVRRQLGLYRPHFDLVLCRLIDEHDRGREKSYSSVLIKVFVDGKEEITAADADGPVHAMDMALRKALEKFYPCLGSARLTDYKVRVLNSEAATGAITRVLIETTDRERSWTTVGVSEDIIEASLSALVDAIEYKLLTE